MMRFRYPVVNCLVHHIFSEREILFQFSDSCWISSIFH
jgi:hypothetical protein